MAFSILFGTQKYGLPAWTFYSFKAYKYIYRHSSQAVDF